MIERGQSGDPRRFWDRLFDLPSNDPLEQAIALNFEMRGYGRRANGSAAKLLKEVTEEATKAGTLNEPANGGDLLLQKEKVDEATGARLGVLRREGVEDDDIRSWWNLPDIERRITLKFDELDGAALCTGAVKNGLSFKDAANDVWKVHPLWGDPADTSFRQGEDRPLPIELRRRINDYHLYSLGVIDIPCWHSTWSLNGDQMKQGMIWDMANYSSYNAFVRHYIKKGSLHYKWRLEFSRRARPRENPSSPSTHLITAAFIRLIALRRFCSFTLPTAV
jgi:hypothetical protein